MCGKDNVPDRKEKCIGVICNEVNRKLNSVYDGDVLGGTKNKIHKMKVSTLRPIEQDQIDLYFAAVITNQLNRCFLAWYEGR